MIDPGLTCCVIRSIRVSAVRSSTGMQISVAGVVEVSAMPKTQHWVPWRRPLLFFALLLKRDSSTCTNTSWPPNVGQWLIKESIFQEHTFLQCWFIFMTVSQLTPANCTLLSTLCLTHQFHVPLIIFDRRILYSSR